MITTEQVPATAKVIDDISIANSTTRVAFALGPEDVKVELVEDKSLTVPARLNHIHFFGQMNKDMREWYAKTFGATMVPPNPASTFVQAGCPAWP